MIVKEKEVGDSDGGNKKEGNFDSSDDQHCLHESPSDDDNKLKFLEGERPKKNPQLQLGMIFPNVKVFQNFSKGVSHK